MTKIKVMFYADAYSATSGYGKVVRELSNRLAQDDNYDVYVQEIVNPKPARVINNVKLLPAYGTRGSDIFISSILNNIRMINPDYYIPICDPFLLVRDGLHKIEFDTSDIKLIPYIPLDGIGIPDTSEDILDNAYHIFTMSNFARKQLLEEYKHVTTLYHGVDFNKFKPAKSSEKLVLRKDFNLKEDDKVFLMLGRNFIRKRHHRTIEAFALFKQLYKLDFKVLCHIAEHDKDPNNLINFIKRMEKKYNVELIDNFIFTDSHKIGIGKDENFITNLYKVSDYYISGTSSEGFGLPTIEAMATKIPVVIPDNSANTELCGDGVWCYLTDNEGFQNTGFGTQQPLVDIENLAEMILMVMEENNTHMVNSAYNFVKKNCNWDDITDKMKEVIK